MHTWYEQAVFYHIYPLGLTGAPKENCETAVSDRFRELFRWIPHMKSLNMTALYIGPLFESTRHGYDTRDYRLVDRRLGTNDDFKNFVEQCHAEGVRVVVDGVFNHTGREFFAFQSLLKDREASPYRDWYRGINFGWGSPLGDPFGYEAWQGHFELPCLNLQNPEVRNYLLDTVRFWVETFDIDGIRLDCAGDLNFAFMEELRSFTASIKENFWLMGEVIHGQYARFVTPSALHSVTNYELHKALYSGHNDHNYFEIAHNVKRLEAVGASLYTFADNHDENRLASKLRKKEHLFPVYQLLFTLPGIPSIYYGSEWGMEGIRSSTSDDALRPAVSMDQEPSLHCGLTDAISSLAGLHGCFDAFHSGQYEELLLTNRQYAFARRGETSLILSAVNNDDTPADVKIRLPKGVSASASAEILFASCGNTEQCALFPSAKEPCLVSAENGAFSVSLPANGGVIYKIVEG